MTAHELAKELLLIPNYEVAGAMLDVHHWLQIRPVVVLKLAEETLNEDEELNVESRS